jgi:signal transduction histidine kinase
VNRLWLMGSRRPSGPAGQVAAERSRPSRRRLRVTAAPSVRMRLTLTYCATFALIGTALLALAYVLIRQSLRHQFADKLHSSMRAGRVPVPYPARLPAYRGTRWSRWMPVGPVSDNRADPVVVAREFADRLYNALLAQTALYLVAALVAVILLALAVGWWVAGRALRPVHRMTETARRVSWHNMRERIALRGPRDEMKELADTFDALLDRLESAFTSQRRFVANAAHELRTPLTIQRAAIQIGLGDGDVTPTELAEVRAELLDANRRSERLIDGLLALARSDRGLQSREPVAVRKIVAEVVDRFTAEAEARGVKIDVSGRPLTVLGDEVLVEQLVTNLVQNAIRHNEQGGLVEVSTDRTCGVLVRNTGPIVPPAELAGLFEPFRRLGQDRLYHREGAGLGLSIVASIVQAHGGRILASANPAGGLTIQIHLPVAGRSVPHEGEEAADERPLIELSQQQTLLSVLDATPDRDRQPPQVAPRRRRLPARHAQPAHDGGQRREPAVAPPKELMPEPVTVPAPSRPRTALVGRHARPNHDMTSPDRVTRLARWRRNG